MVSYESALAALRVAYHAGLAGTPAMHPLGPWGDAAEALGLRDRRESLRTRVDDRRDHDRHPANPL